MSTSMVKLPEGLTDYSILPKSKCFKYNHPKVYEYEGKKTANPVILNDSWKLKEGSNLVQRYFRKDCEPFEDYDGKGNYAQGKETKHFQSERKVKEYLKQLYLKREAKKTQNPEIQEENATPVTTPCVLGHPKSYNVPEIQPADNQGEELQDRPKSGPSGKAKGRSPVVKSPPRKKARIGKVKPEPVSLPTSPSVQNEATPPTPLDSSLGIDDDVPAEPTPGGAVGGVPKNRSNKTNRRPQQSRSALITKHDNAKRAYDNANTAKQGALQSLNSRMPEAEREKQQAEAKRSEHIAAATEYLKDNDFVNNKKYSREAENCHRRIVTCDRTIERLCKALKAAEDKVCTAQTTYEAAKKKLQSAERQLDGWFFVKHLDGSAGHKPGPKGGKGQYASWVDFWVQVTRAQVGSVVLCPGCTTKAPIEEVFGNSSKKIGDFHGCHVLIARWKNDSGSWTYEEKVAIVPACGRCNSGKKNLPKRATAAVIPPLFGRIPRTILEHEEWRYHFPNDIQQPGADNRDTALPYWKTLAVTGILWDNQKKNYKLTLRGQDSSQIIWNTARSTAMSLQRTSSGSCKAEAHSKLYNDFSMFVAKGRNDFMLKYLGPLLHLCFNNNPEDPQKVRENPEILQMKGEPLCHQLGA